MSEGARGSGLSLPCGKLPPEALAPLYWPAGIAIFALSKLGPIHDTGLIALLKLMLIFLILILGISLNLFYFYVIAAAVAKTLGKIMSKQ